MYMQHEPVKPLCTQNNRSLLEVLKCRCLQDDLDQLLGILEVFSSASSHPTASSTRPQIGRMLNQAVCKAADQEMLHCPFIASSIRLHQTAHRLMLSDTLSAEATAQGVLSSNQTVAALHTVWQTHKPADQEMLHCPFGASCIRLHQTAHRLMLSDMLSAGATATGVPSSHHKAAALHTAPASRPTHECANQTAGHCPLQACSNRTDECRGSPCGDPGASGVAGWPGGAAVLCDCAKR